MTGDIANPNMWDRALSEGEINTMNCDAQGNLVNSSSIRASENVVWFNESYQCSGK